MRLTHDITTGATRSLDGLDTPWLGRSQNESLFVVLRADRADHSLAAGETLTLTVKQRGHRNADPLVSVDITSADYDTDLGGYLVEFSSDTTAVRDLLGTADGETNTTTSKIVDADLSLTEGTDPFRPGSPFQVLLVNSVRGVDDNSPVAAPNAAELWLRNPGVYTALTGGAAGALDAEVTANGSMQTGTCAATALNGTLVHWQLTASTHVEDSTHIRPDDYNASTNARVWFQISSGGGGGGGGAVDSVNGQTGVVVLTKSDLSLGNVDNTSDAGKPVSTAQAAADSAVASAADAALSSHTGDTNNPHGVTKTQIGLGNVDNTTDAGKPVSTAQAAADAAVASAAASALATHTGNTNNPHGVTKAQVGLGSVDNTSDAGKPVSTAQAAALAAKTTTISGGGLASGGGDLSANRTITVPEESQANAQAGTASGAAMTARRVADAINAQARLLRVSGLIRGYSSPPTAGSYGYVGVQINGTDSSVASIDVAVDAGWDGATFSFYLDEGSSTSPTYQIGLSDPMNGNTWIDSNGFNDNDYLFAVRNAFNNWIYSIFSDNRYSAANHGGGICRFVAENAGTGHGITINGAYGSGGYTDGTDSSLPADTVVSVTLYFSSVAHTETFSLTASDPMDGHPWIDTSAFTALGEFVTGLHDAINTWSNSVAGQSVAGTIGGVSFTIRTASASASDYVSGDYVGGSGVTFSPANTPTYGTAGSAGSGNVDSVDLVSGVTGKRVRSIRAWVTCTGSGLGTVYIGDSNGNAYAAATPVAGSVVELTFTTVGMTLFLNPTLSQKLRAYFSTSQSANQSATIYAIAEQY